MIVYVSGSLPAAAVPTISVGTAGASVASWSSSRTKNHQTAAPATATTTTAATAAIAIRIGDSMTMASTAKRTRRADGNILICRT